MHKETVERKGQGPRRLATLPDNLTDQKLAIYIKENAIKEETHFTRRYFTDEELQALEHESAEHGRTIHRLTGLLKEVRDYIKHGAEAEITIKIPATVGTKASEEFRAQDYQFLEDGFEMIEVAIFGFPNKEAGLMEYVTLNGEIVEERTRKLTQREIDDLFGVKRMAADRPGRLVDESEIDKESGEWRAVGG